MGRIWHVSFKCLCVLLDHKFWISTFWIQNLFMWEEFIAENLNWGNGVFPECNGYSVDSWIQRIWQYHWCINWGQFKNPVCYMRCLLTTWEVTQSDPFDPRILCYSLHWIQWKSSEETQIVETDWWKWKGKSEQNEDSVIFARWTSLIPLHKPYFFWIDAIDFATFLISKDNFQRGKIFWFLLNK